MKSEVLEWLHQAEYDYEDASYLLPGKHPVFCCHLAVEKGLNFIFTI